MSAHIEERAYESDLTGTYVGCSSRVTLVNRIARLLGIDALAGPGWFVVHHGIGPDGPWLHMVSRRFDSKAEAEAEADEDE